MQEAGTDPRIDYIAIGELIENVDPTFLTNMRELLNLMAPKDQQDYGFKHFDSVDGAVQSLRTHVTQELNKQTSQLEQLGQRIIEEVHTAATTTLKAIELTADKVP